MLWLGKWNISIFLYAILMAPSMHKCIHSTHPFLLSRCTSVGSSFSHPTTRNSPCCNISFFKLHFWRSQYSSLLTPQSTGWKMMEQCVFIHLTDGNLMIQLPGCVNEGSIQYPPPSKRKLETLFTMDPNRMMIQLLLPRPLGGLYISLAAGHPMIHHLDFETSCRCP